MNDFMSPAKEGFHLLKNESEKVLHRVLLGDLSFPTFARESYRLRNVKTIEEEKEQEFHDSNSKVSFHLSSKNSSPSKDTKPNFIPKSVEEIMREYGNEIADEQMSAESCLVFFKESLENAKNIFDFEEIAKMKNPMENLFEILKKNEFSSKFHTGILIACFHILHYKRKIVDIHFLESILNSIFLHLEGLKDSNFANEENYLIFAFCEVIGIIGPLEFTIHYLECFADRIFQVNSFLIGKIFFTLSLLGFKGIEKVLQTASCSSPQISKEILEAVSKSNEVKALIILPKLLEEIKRKQKFSALRLLKKLGPLISKTKLLPFLSQNLDDSEKKYIEAIAEAIISSGEEGIKLILKKFSLTKEEEVKSQLLSALKSFEFKESSTKIFIEIEDYKISSHFLFKDDEIKFLSGNESAMQYGSETDKWDLKMNSKEFVSALHKLQKTKELYNEEAYSTHLDLLDLNLKESFVIYTLFSLENADDNSNALQTHRILQLKLLIFKSLEGFLDTKSPNLKINLIQTISSLKLENKELFLGKYLSDHNPVIRKSSLEELFSCEDISKESTKNSVFIMLNDNLWKIRKRALDLILKYSICYSKGLDSLCKSFREGKLSRGDLCHAIALQGENGICALLKYLKSCTPNDCKLMISIIDSFKLVNSESPLLDKILEEICARIKESPENLHLVCLETLEYFHEKFPKENPYLRDEFIVPIYYKSLSSQHESVKTVNHIIKLALHFLLKFGNQAQLLFLEALKTEINSDIKCQCLKGLSMFGNTSLRTLFVCLDNNDQSLARLASELIYEMFSNQKILHETLSGHEIRNFVIILKRLFQKPVLHFDGKIIEFLKDLNAIFQDSMRNK